MEYKAHKTSTPGCHYPACRVHPRTFIMTCCIIPPEISSMTETEKLFCNCEAYDLVQQIPKIKTKFC